MLMEIFENIQPKYLRWQFSEMINVGLVLAGVKNGALVYITEPTIIHKLKKSLNVQQYTQHGLEHLILISNKKIPSLPPDDNQFHVKVGKILSYMTPIDIEEAVIGIKKNVAIEIIFDKNGGKKYVTAVLSQIVVNKTDDQINAYFKKYIDAILAMKIPKIFTIHKVCLRIE